jgi:DNA-binding response OmpR family regulator
MMSQTLLIVDDAKSLHELVKMHLGTEDFNFESVFTGSAALDIAASLQPDLILLDVGLPDMNGFDVCRFLKTTPGTARIPVIFLTAAASPDEKLCGLNLQAADYITKPFQPEELAYRVRAALRTKRLLDLLPAGKRTAALSSPQGAQNPNARLSLSQVQAVRGENPWNRKPPGKLVSGQ